MSKLYNLLHDLDISRFPIKESGCVPINGCSLCKRCAPIASRITSGKLPAFREAIDIGHIENLYCDLCYFLHALRPTVVEEDDWPGFNLVIAEDLDWRLNAMVVVRKKAGQYINGRERRPRKAIRNGYILDTSSLSSLRGRVLDRYRINLGLLRDWVGECEKDHAEGDCGKRLRLDLKDHVQGFQVIDCRRNYIVTPAVDCKYAALSYVWGDSQS